MEHAPVTMCSFIVDALALEDDVAPCTAIGSATCVRYEQGVLVLGGFHLFQPFSAELNKRNDLIAERHFFALESESSVHRWHQKTVTSIAQCRPLDKIFTQAGIPAVYIIVAVR